MRNAECGIQPSRESGQFARTHIRGYVVVVAKVSRR